MIVGGAGEELYVNYDVIARRPPSAEQLALQNQTQKQQMFEQLRSLQTVHERRLEEHRAYSSKVTDLSSKQYERESAWRLSHLEQLDRRIAVRAKLGEEGVQTVGEGARVRARACEVARVLVEAA